MVILRFDVLKMSFFFVLFFFTLLLHLLPIPRVASICLGSGRILIISVKKKMIFGTLSLNINM